MWGVDIAIDGATPPATARPAEAAGSGLAPGTAPGQPRRSDGREDDAEHDGEIPIVTVDYDAPFADVSETAARGLDDQTTPTIIAIAAGRGGAGKSLLAANMAVYLAQVGKRVVAVDADPAGGTLNHLLGTPRPARGFGSFLRGRAETLDELAVDTPVAGVRLIAGETLAFGSPRPRSNGKAVLAALRAISADIIVVDLGPPDSALCLDLWLGAQTSILVTLADPASIEATYRFVKSAFLRRLRGERGLDKLQAQGRWPSPARRAGPLPRGPGCGRDRCATRTRATAPRRGSPAGRPVRGREWTVARPGQDAGGGRHLGAGDGAFSPPVRGGANPVTRRHQAGPSDGDGGAPPPRSRVRLSRARGVRRDRRGGQPAAPSGDGGVSRSQGLSQHRKDRPPHSFHGDGAPFVGTAAPAGGGTNVLRDPGDGARSQRRGDQARLSRLQGDLRSGLAGGRGAV